MWMQQSVVICCDALWCRSYLRLPQWSPTRRGRIEFSFKTIQQHGVMMVSSPRRGRSDFFAVELSDGDLYVLFNLGGATQRFLIGRDVNDGRTHYVRIDRNGRGLYLTLDREQHEDHLAGGDDGSLDLGSTLYVGGTASRDQLPWPLYSRRRPEFYRGCLWDLRLDDGDLVELVSLWRSQGMPGVSAGCTQMPDECTATACQHGGVCREHWDGHACDCAPTYYTDARCHRGLLCCFAPFALVVCCCKAVATNTHTHTHTCLTALFPGLPR